MLEANKGYNGLRQTGERDCADERARHSTREVEMVIRSGEPLAGGVADGRAVDENVVGGLEVEGLLDFGVGCCEEVEEGDEEEERVEEGVYYIR